PAGHRRQTGSARRQTAGTVRPCKGAGHEGSRPVLSRLQLLKFRRRPSWAASGLTFTRTQIQVCPSHVGCKERCNMTNQESSVLDEVSSSELIALLNDDLAREYQAIIAYVVYSRVLKGAQFMNIAAELEKHAGEELQHALTVAAQIAYLGGMP